MRILRRTAKWLFVCFGVAVFVIVSYLGAALVTARIPGETGQIASGEKNITLKLLFGTLHTDIALPATPELARRFAFLRNTGVALDHPNLRYITIGWGSRAFYTTAGTYLDIKVSAVFRAAIGDDAVLRAVSFGDLADAPDIVDLKLSAAQYERLLNAVEQALHRVDGRVQHLADESIGPGDAFFEALGDFHIFNPCNQWVNETLRSTGIQLGIWTPTSQSLRQSLVYFGNVAASQP